MTTNSPNPVDGDVQALTEKERIKQVEVVSSLIEKIVSDCANGWTAERDYLLPLQIALASLTAKHVGKVCNDEDAFGAKNVEWEVCLKEGTKLYTTPPAQLLRPVELSKSDGWIEWSGGDCPVFDYSLVETKWSSGAIVEDCAGEFDWSFEDGSCNIIAYRVVRS
jgi:hypothetical protein